MKPEPNSSRQDDKFRIIVAEGDEALRSSIAQTFLRKGYPVSQARDGQSLCRALKEQGVGLVLLDLELGDQGGPSLVARIREDSPLASVILLVNGSPPGRLDEALKLGASDFVRKPLSLDDLVWRVHCHLLQLQGARQGEPALSSQEDVLWSAATVGIRKSLEKAATSPATVLITGETGTGKEVAARTLHALSQRRGRELYSVNCAALSPTLLESEIFGHEKGAFTSATTQRKGRFEMAAGGTLLLDEIGELSLPLQAKLLRVLQDRAFERVGSSRTMKVDVRIIATTNRNLQEEVKEGRFRADLFFRLDVLHVEMPALRSRRQEIPLFLEHFARRRNTVLRMDPEVLEFLSRYDWPGNVRELENLVERWITMGKEDYIGLDQLPARMRSHVAKMPTSSIELEDPSLAAAELRQIASVLDRVKGNRSQAAELLGIDRGTLRAKMMKHGLEGSPTRVRMRRQFSS